MFGPAAAVAYVAQRLYERFTGGVGDPTLVVREAHTSFYWRASAALWWGGVFAFSAYFWLRNRPEEAAPLARRVAWWSAPVFPGLALAMWLYP